MYIYNSTLYYTLFIYYIYLSLVLSLLHYKQSTISVREVLNCHIDCMHIRKRTRVCGYVCVYAILDTTLTIWQLVANYQQPTLALTAGRIGRCIWPEVLHIILYYYTVTSWPKCQLIINSLIKTLFTNSLIHTPSLDK